jgi:hypothetical protein
MIQGFTQSQRFDAPRRAAAVLLAVFLNVAMIPCSMAVEVIEHEHDCCPPELQLKASECCELDNVSVDARDGTLELKGDIEAGPAPHFESAILPAPPRYAAATDPPDPTLTSTDLNKLYCVYLK